MSKPDETSSSDSDGPPGRILGREDPDPVRGRRIQDTREALRRTQISIAREIGRAEKSVSNWEHGNTISGESLVKLAEALGVSADYIEFGDEQAASPEPDLVGDMNQWQLDRIEELVGELLDRLNTIDKRIAGLEEKNPQQAILRMLRLIEADRSRQGRDIGRRDLQGRDGPDRHVELGKGSE